MKGFIAAKWIGAALAIGVAASAAAGETQDARMQALATQSGCLTCHAIHHADANGVGQPIGPTWEDVALKYRGQKDAAAQLAQTVMNGSSPYASHWKGKVTGLAMPPNAVAIKEADAKQLTAWILTLKK